MDQSAQAIPCPDVAPTTRSVSRGVTLPDLGLALISLLLVGILAVTTILQRQHAARITRVAGELQAFSRAFQEFTAQHTSAPPSTNEDQVVPAGMETLLHGTTWTEETAVGGHYRWTQAVPDPKEQSDERRALGTLSITAFMPDQPLSLTLQEMRRIDELIDDGNLATGNFRSGFNGWPAFTVRAKN
jgi:hypothetical protein